MLLLQRKRGESIVLPQYGIVVRVLHSGAKSVRLGVTAPKHVAVYREEVWRRLQCLESEASLEPKRANVRALAVGEADDQAD